MIVLVLERVTPGLRGRLTRWLLEVHPGVFVGAPSARVANELWDAVVRSRGKKGACTFLRSADTEQRFEMRTVGSPSRQPVDFDGLQLMLRSQAPF